MSYMAILIQREFWEHRNTFIVLPAIVAGLMFSVMLAGVLYAPLNINFSSETTSVAKWPTGANFHRAQLRG